jgi:ABC-type spermidine/putrescine transport system permease subunit II
MGGRGGLLPGGPFASIFLVALFAVTLIVLAIAFYRLYQKAGFSGAIGLLMLVPVVNLGVALYLAFAEWPVMAELARVKLLAASAAFPATADAMRSAPPAASTDVTGPAVPRTS